MIASLVGADHIQVALHDDCLVLSPDAAPGFVQPVKQVAFVEEHGLRGVEILGHVVRQDGAGAVAGHSAAPIADREDHPVAEAVVEAAVIALGGQAGGDQILAGVAFFQEFGVGGFPSLWGVAKFKDLDSFIGQAAIMQIIEGNLALRVVEQLMAEVGGGLFQQLAKVVVFFPAGGLFRCLGT